MGIVEGSCGNRARGDSIRGQFVLSRNMGYRTRGVAMLLNIVLTPGKPTPKSNFRDRTQCELWVLLPPLPRWGPVPGENSFYRAPGGEMGPGDARRVPIAAVRHGGARQSSESGQDGDCRRVLWEPGPRGQYSGKIRFIEKYGVQDEGGSHVAKYSSDPRQAYPVVKHQGRDLVRVVGIVAPFTPMGAGTRGKFVLSSPRGEMGPEDVRRVPLAAVRHGRARQTSESGPGGDCRRVLWEPCPRGQYSRKIRFIEKYGVQDEGGRHVAEYSSDPRQAYPEVKFQARDLVRVVDIVAPLCPDGGRYPGKIRFIEPQGGNGS